MEWKEPTASQVHRLSAAIALYDRRGDAKVSAERFHQNHIDEMELSGIELDMMSDLIENVKDTYEEHPESMLIARYIAEGLSVKNLHFLFTIVRCHQSIADIANHFGGGYEDYPVITVQEVFNENLRPRKKWGTGRQRLTSAQYDRMASILVAMYLNRSMGLDGSCMHRIDMYREVIEPLLQNEDVVRRQTPAVLAVVYAANEVLSSGSLLRSSTRVNMDVHAFIKLALLMDEDDRNLGRALEFVRERRNLDIRSVELFLRSSAPVLIGGTL